MKFIKSKKGLVLLATLAVAIAAAVGAYAYFTSTGHGTGTASTGSAANFTVAQDAFGGPGPAAVTLYPGQGIQALTGTVTNAGSGNQAFTTIVANIVAPTGANVAGPPACTAADYALSSPGHSWVISNGGDTATLTLAAQDLAPNGVYHWSDLSVAMNDLAHNQNACQAATVNLTYDVS